MKSSLWISRMMAEIFLVSHSPPPKICTLMLQKCHENHSQGWCDNERACICIPVYKLSNLRLLWSWFCSLDLGRSLYSKLVYNFYSLKGTSHHNVWCWNFKTHSVYHSLLDFEWIFLGNLVNHWFCGNVVNMLKDFCRWNVWCVLLINWPFFFGENKFHIFTRHSVLQIIMGLLALTPLVHGQLIRKPTVNG